jgi:hypothetical protein
VTVPAERIRAANAAPLRPERGLVLEALRCDGPHASDRLHADPRVDGTMRYMSSERTPRKVALAGWLARWGEAAKALPRRGARR